ncbi:MAG: right-handed parallel beta-helix repeat-containing protein [Gemmatimonadota bacterium]
MKHLRSLLALPLSALAASCSDGITGPSPTSLPAGSLSAAAVEVDSQAGLQAALDAPLAGPSVRVVRLAGDFTLASTITYAGQQELRIEGRGATITGPAGGDALTVTGGADLTLRDVTIAGAAGHGVYVDVPAGAAGTVDVALHGVTLRDNGLSGLWVEDQEHASPASVSLAIQESRIERNGFRAGAEFADFDGVRVNEGGAGDLELVMHRSVVTGNAADGVELDERGAGDVEARVQHTVFTRTATSRRTPATWRTASTSTRPARATSGPGSRTSARTATRTRGSTWTRREPAASGPCSTGWRRRATWTPASP